MDIQKLISRYGGRTAFARTLGVTPQAVHKWEKNYIPAARAIQIEQLTGGEITIKDLRPDLFEETAA